MMFAVTVLRLIAVVIGFGAIAYGAADFVVSGEKFTWPPPASLSYAALKGDAKVLMHAYLVSPGGFPDSGKK